MSEKTKKLLLYEVGPEKEFPNGAALLSFVDPTDKENPKLLAHVAIFPIGGKSILLPNVGTRLDELGYLTEKEKAYYGPNGEMFFDVMVFDQLMSDDSAEETGSV